MELLKRYNVSYVRNEYGEGVAGHTTIFLPVWKWFNLTTASENIKKHSNFKTSVVITFYKFNGFHLQTKNNETNK